METTNEKLAKQALTELCNNLKNGRLVIILRKQFDGTGISVELYSISDRYSLLNHRWALQQLGFKFTRKWYIRVSGGGMDLTLHLVDIICRRLKALGYDAPDYNEVRYQTI